MSALIKIISAPGSQAASCPLASRPKTKLEGAAGRSQAADHARGALCTGLRTTAPWSMRGGPRQFPAADSGAASFVASRSPASSKIDHALVGTWGLARDVISSKNQSCVLVILTYDKSCDANWTRWPNVFLVIRDSEL